MFSVFVVNRASVEETKVMEAKVLALSKDKAKAEQKLNNLNGKLTKLSSDLKDEKDMNQSLRQNQVRFYKLQYSYCKYNLQGIVCNLTSLFFFFFFFL